MPSSRTLRDYTHYNNTTIGFSTATDNDLLSLVKAHKPWQRIVTLILDEMYICKGVVYDKHSGHIIGYTDMGDITNHLQRYISTGIYKPYSLCFSYKLMLAGLLTVCLLYYKNLLATNPVIQILGLRMI